MNIYVLSGGEESGNLRSYRVYPLSAHIHLGGRLPIFMYRLCNILLGYYYFCAFFFISFFMAVCINYLGVRTKCEYGVHRLLSF